LGVDDFFTGEFSAPFCLGKRHEFFIVFDDGDCLTVFPEGRLLIFSAAGFVFSICSFGEKRDGIDGKEVVLGLASGLATTISCVSLSAGFAWAACC